MTVAVNTRDGVAMQRAGIVRHRAIHPDRPWPAPVARRCAFCDLAAGSERKCTNCGAPLDAVVETNSRLPPPPPQTPMPSGGRKVSR